MNVVDDYVDLENPVKSHTVSVNVQDDDKKFETLLREMLNVISTDQNHLICIAEIKKDIRRLVNDYTNSVNMVLAIVSFVCIFILLLK